MDASNSKRILEEYAIKAYPTIKWFSKGRHHEFRGQKTVVGMLNWVTDRIKMEAKRSTEIKKCEDLDSLVKEVSNSKDRKFLLIYFGETYENMYKNIHMQFPDPA